MMRVEKNEIVELLEDGFEVAVQVGEDYFKIGDMHGYVGAPEGKEGYISEYLGNFWYEDAKTIIDETVRGMSEGTNVEVKYFADI